jgi:hypothetical protein
MSRASFDTAAIAATRTPRLANPVSSELENLVEWVEMLLRLREQSAM